ncbi:MAG: GAF domain-containing protein [Nostocaceae cyanobacterium]|nr:GAF domain-containing protein [Nostocaceae cyanobacterium]
MTIIPPDVLKDLVKKEGLTPAEEEVLSLALDGKSTAEIQKELGIESQNAVQKRLGKVYAKFRLTGAGPGKLPKLQKILTDRYQSQIGPKKVLIFWFSEFGKDVAEQMSDILKHPQIEVSISDTDINLGSLWVADTIQSLKGINYSIVCLTPGFSENSWVNFAVGFLSAKIDNFKLVRFSGEKLPEPLLRFPTVNGTKEDNLAELLHNIIGGDIQEAKDWVDFKVSSSNWWEQVVRQQLKKSFTDDSSESQLVLQAGLQILKDNKYFQNNELFQTLIIKALTDVGNEIEKVGSNGRVFSIPLELYARYLVSLQEDMNSRVQAVSLVDDVDHFWANDKGDEIANTANKNSERIFIFSDIGAYRKSTKFLLKHGSKYNVYVMLKYAYEPFAEEFCIDTKTVHFQNDDHNLPTKQYAIIESSDNSQLLVWYNENNLKDKRHKRLVNFSATSEQVYLYKDAFYRVRTSKYSIHFDLKNIKSPEEIADFLRDVENRLYDIPKIDITPESLLSHLQEVRNQLISLKDENDVINKALSFVRDKLHSQTASIFMFGKDGLLHRKGIQGVDSHGKDIDNHWFSTEKYAVGESFTGKTAYSQEDGFGKPQCSNNLKEEDLDGESRDKYYKKLGKMNSFLAVPLNGQNKTYGVLEVINKIHPITKKITSYYGFTKDEIHWLSTIASAVATALSNIRRNRQNKLESDISNFLVNYQDEQKAYDEVVTRLVSEHTAFEVCILRVKNKSGMLELKAKKYVERINWEDREDECIKPGEGFVGKVVESKKEEIVEDIEQQIQEFNNKEWIINNKFKSFACFPLVYYNEVIGTLSVYTKYNYKFHDSCQEFLKRVSSLIAAFIVRTKVDRVNVYNSTSETNSNNQAGYSVS